MESQRKPDIEITELFMAKCGNDWRRTFVGTIKRYTEPDGSNFIVGRIPVNDCTIIARAKDKKELYWKVDEMVKLILDYKILCFG